MRRLVYLSPVPWSSFAQRPHKFVEWFHNRSGENVLWIDPYPTRLPTLDDCRQIGTRKDMFNHQLPHWLTVIRPRSFPVEPFPFSEKLNGLFWKDILTDIKRFAFRAPTMVVIGKPSVFALELLKSMNGIPSLYDAMDDFPAFYSGISRAAMAAREKLLVRQIAHIFASSTNLQKRWLPIRDDVRLVRNGLDVDAMPCQKSNSISRSRKVLGYVGTVGHWFDWDWVITLARTRPKNIVRIIGPIHVSPPCRLPINVELVPPMEHKAALKSMLDFDVGLIPFKINELTASVDPIKYYEYRSLGLPVVSTVFGEMALRTGEQGIFLSDGLEYVNDLVNAALMYIPEAGEIQQFRINNSWQARFEASGILS